MTRVSINGFIPTAFTLLFFYLEATEATSMGWLLVWLPLAVWLVYKAVMLAYYYLIVVPKLQKLSDVNPGHLFNANKNTGHYL